MNLPIPSPERQLVLAEHAPSTRPEPRRSVRRIGRLRLPLTTCCRPWLTLYRLPDGRLLWCVRLWALDRAEPRVVTTDTLRRFADQNRLPQFRADVDRLLASAVEREV